MNRHLPMASGSCVMFGFWVCASVSWVFCICFFAKQNLVYILVDGSKLSLVCVCVLLCLRSLFSTQHHIESWCVMWTLERLERHQKRRKTIWCFFFSIEQLFLKVVHMSAEFIVWLLHLSEVPQFCPQCGHETRRSDRRSCLFSGRADSKLACK